MPCYQVHPRSRNICVMFPTGKMGSKASGVHNGEQSKIYHLCWVLSYVFCEFCFMVRNASNSMITFNAVQVSLLSGKFHHRCSLMIPSCFLISSHPRIVWMWSILVSFISDKTGVIRITQVWVLGISVICGVVFTSDQICLRIIWLIGSMVRTYFSHRFGVYSHVFGVYQSV